MPVQIRFIFRETLCLLFRETRYLLTSGGLLIAAASGLGGCDTSSAAVATERSAAESAPATQSFVARARQRLLFVARPSASPAEAEAYYKANILPALTRDRRIGEVAAYVDGKTGRYIIELELRTPTAADFSLAVDVLAVGSTVDNAERILDGLAGYFDLAGTQQLARRDDLSISRSILGSVDGGAP